MSFSFAITSASSFALASLVSVALLNSKSSVDAMFTMAGFFGAGVASGLGAGCALISCDAEGVGAGAGLAAGAGAGAGAAGFGASCVAHAPNASAIEAVKNSVLVFIAPPVIFRLRNRRHLITPSTRQTSRFCEGKPALARCLARRRMLKFRS